MPRVILTEYEVEHDLLPPLCIKCGKPATERFHRTVRFLDDPGRWGGLYVLTFLFTIYCLPPLLLVLLRRARAFRVKIPFCPSHLNRFRRRERIALGILVPLWVTVSLAIDTVLAAALYHQPGGTCMLAAGVATFIAAVDRFAAWRARRRGQKRPLRFNLPFVHPAFVAALTEDRARDRIDNPDRRGGHGDVRDDYDDEAG